MAQLCSLASGSSGNSIYVGSEKQGILIDCGISCRAMEQALAAQEIPIQKISGLFVTHEHTDHIKGIKRFCDRFAIPVYGSKGTIAYLTDHDLVTPATKVFCVEEDGVTIGDMKIIPFHTSHDSSESTGFVVCTDDGKRTGIATDLGYVSREVFESIKGSDAVVLESNYDVRMLETGKYPYYLKRRIRSDRGHLSNEECAENLVKLLSGGTTRFLLAHLSKDNNIPELAYETACSILMLQGCQQDVDFQLKIAPRSQPGSMICY